MAQVQVRSPHSSTACEINAMRVNRDQVPCHCMKRLLQTAEFRVRRMEGSGSSLQAEGSVSCTRSFQAMEPLVDVYKCFMHAAH